MISPRQQFQQTLQPESKFRSIILSDDIQRAFSFSLAQLAKECPTKEQLQGAIRFLEVLTSLGEPEAPPAKFLDKKLDHSVFNPIEIPQGETKKK